MPANDKTFSQAHEDLNVDVKIQTLMRLMSYKLLEENIQHSPTSRSEEIKTKSIFDQIIVDVETGEKHKIKDLLLMLLFLCIYSCHYFLEAFSSEEERFEQT